MDVTLAGLWLVSGERGAGKTSFCHALARQARRLGWDVAGIVSPGVFDGETKTGILTEDLRTGETRRLADYRQHGSFDLPFGKWFFDRSTLAWGNQVLANCLPCQLLIIDELGPLEFIRQEGWLAALDVLRRDAFQIGLVVIRPSLEDLAHQVLPFSARLVIDGSRSAEQWAGDFWVNLLPPSTRSGVS